MPHWQINVLSASLVGLTVCQNPGFAQAAIQKSHLSQRDSVAIATIKTLLQSATVVDFYYRWGNQLHQQEQLMAAVQIYQNALRLNPHHPPSLINQGLTWLELGQAQPAIQDFQAILLIPDVAIAPATLHTLAHYNLAIIYKRLGEFTAARESVLAALQITPDFQRGQMLLQQLSGQGSAQHPQ